MIKAHGGGNMIGGILNKTTTTNVDMPVHMKGMDRLIRQTTGMVQGESAMDGVITSTVPASMRSVPELHKVPVREVGKTDSRMSVGIPYAGKKSGYGAASKHSK
jgi:hypothetical protein